MSDSERPLVEKIIESLNDPEQEDDAQMALLLRQLEVLEGDDLPVEEIADFLLMKVKDGDDIWLLVNYHMEAWQAGLDIVECDPDRITVGPVLEALRHARERIERDAAQAERRDSYLDGILALAGVLGPECPREEIHPFTEDVRQSVRCAVVNAWYALDAKEPLLPMLADPSPAVRALVIEKLALLHALPLNQAQAMADDPQAEEIVREAVTRWKPFAEQVQQAQAPA